VSEMANIVIEATASDFKAALPPAAVVFSDSDPYAGSDPYPYLHATETEPAGSPRFVSELQAAWPVIHMVDQVTRKPVPAEWNPAPVSGVVRRRLDRFPHHIFADFLSEFVHR